MKESDFLTIETFVDYGNRASYYFADDTTGEWPLGFKERNKAVDIYYANPPLQEKMYEKAAAFIWDLNKALKENPNGIPEPYVDDEDDDEHNN